MTSTQAILVSAMVIAASIIIVGNSHTATAYANGPYQLVHHSNTVAPAGVFKIDTSTGEVSYCFLPGSSNGEIICTRPVK